MKSLQRVSFSMKHIKVQYVYVGLLAYFLFELVNMTQQSKKKKVWFVPNFAKNLVIMRFVLQYSWKL